MHQIIVTEISSFNPATVWFERVPRCSEINQLYLFQSRNGLIWTSWGRRSRPPQSSVSIPQRSDLNHEAAPRVYHSRRWFQSRNGLIWTWGVGDCTYLSLPGFNPATVWFERCSSCMEAGRSRQFQSRNGLIWTLIIIGIIVCPNVFQSRNGLIWTVHYIS